MRAAKDKKMDMDDQIRLLSHKSKKSMRLERMHRQTAYYVMLFVPILFFLIFKYWPMFGLAMGFQNYKVGAPFIGGDTEWVGFMWFQRLLENPFFGRLVRNTLMISGLSLIISFPLSILMALLLNEIRVGVMRKFTANLSLLPHFISTVVIVGVMFNFFSLDDGVFNALLTKLGLEKIDFMGSEKWFRTMYIGSDVWQNTGFNAVVFTAAISGISPTLYEAAALDGSTRLKNIFYITLPNILPTVVIMFLLKIGNLMSVGAEKILLMYTPSIYETADTLSTYAYRAGILDGKFSLSTAIGFFNAVCNLILLVVANRTVKKITDTSLW